MAPTRIRQAPRSDWCREFLGEISTFLHQHRRQSEPRERSADAVESLGRDGHARQRIVLGGIEAERDHQRTGVPTRGWSLLHPSNAASQASSFVPSGHGNIEVGAEPCAGAAIMGKAPEIRDSRRRDRRG